MKVEVFISTYNRANLVGRAIDSVIAQTFKDWQLTIIDDCSKDDTLSVLNKYAQEDNRIKVIAGKKNLGPYVSKIPYLLKSKGEYIAILDDDDYWVPTSLKVRVNAMDENPSCPVCYSDCWRIDRNGKKRYWDCSAGKPFPNILSPSALLRGSYFRKLGGWDKQFYIYHAELDYYLRVSDYAGFIHIPRPLAVTTAPSNSESQNRIADAEMLRLIVVKHLDLLEKDRKRLAYFFARIGLHTVEGGGNGRPWFVKSIDTYLGTWEAWGGLVLPRWALLLLYRVYRRLEGYDSRVYENTVG